MFPEHDKIHLRGEIPERKLATAVKTYELSDPDSLLLLYDDTVFGSAKDGFILTDKRLCYKNIACDPVMLEWDAIEPEAIRPGDAQVHVAGGAGPGQVYLLRALRLVPGGGQRRPRRGGRPMRARSRGGLTSTRPRWSKAASCHWWST